MTLQETVSKILKRNVSVDEAKDFANNQFGVLTTFIRENHANEVEAELFELIANSKINSKHISDCKALKVNVFDYTELVFHDNDLKFLDRNGHHYSLYCDCELEDLIDIISANK